MAIDACRSPKPQTQARPGPGTLTGVDKAKTAVTLASNSGIRIGLREWDEAPITDAWGERESGASTLNREQQHFNRN
jgi:hypothetical protein